VRPDHKRCRTIAIMYVRSCGGEDSMTEQRGSSYLCPYTPPLHMQTCKWQNPLGASSADTFQGRPRRWRRPRECRIGLRSRAPVETTIGRYRSGTVGTPFVLRLQRADLRSVGLRSWQPKAGCRKGFGERSGVRKRKEDRPSGSMTFKCTVLNNILFEVA